MALDEPKADDQRFEVDGLSFVMRPMEADAIASYGGVFVDYIDNFLGRGFLVSVNAALYAECG